MEQLKKKLGSLLTVKGIITVMLTVVFTVLAARGDISAEQFLTVFTLVIAFHFDTRSKKGNDT